MQIPIRPTLFLIFLLSLGSLAGPAEAKNRPPAAEKLFSQALSLRDQGLDEAALQPLREALALTRRDMAINRVYMELMQRRGLQAELQEQYRAARDRAPQVADWHYLYGAASGDPAVARTEFEAGLRLDPGNQWCLQGLGAVLAIEGDLDGAIARYKEALLIAPHEAEIHNKLANVYLAKGEQDAAYAAWRQAIDFAPDDYHAYMNMGALLSMNGDLEGAAALLEEGVRRAPSNPLAHTNYGYVLFKLQRFEEAKAHFAAAIAINPRDRTIRGSLQLVEEIESGKIPFAAYAPYERALAAQLRDPSSSIQHYKEVLLLAPNFAIAQMNLGLAQLAAGDTDAALKSLRKAVELAPQEAGALYNLGYMLLGQGSVAEGRGYLEQAHEIDPEDGDVLVALALSSLADERAKEAVAWYREALELSPRDPVIWFQMGSAQAAGGDFDGGERSLRRALKLTPGFLMARVQLINLLREARRFEEALAELAILEEAAPEHPDLKTQRAALEASRDVLRSGARSGEVRVSQILLDDEDTARRLIGELERGAPFARLARAHSLGPAAIRGGDVGFVDPKELRSEIAQALAVLQPGEVSGVVDLGGSYLILKRAP